MAVDDLKKIISECKKILLDQRDKRVKPGLDDKILISWNALMLKAYVDSFKAFGEERFLESAVKSAEFLEQKCSNADGGLFHTFKNGKARINGYLEDYSFTIEAFIALYEITFNEQYWLKARLLADYCYANFYIAQTGWFYFTSSLDSPLVTRKKETEDNVIPASCSSLAKALYILGLHFTESRYKDSALKMLSQVTDNLIRYGSSYSNWGILLLNVVYPYYEIALVGIQAKEMAKEISGLYLPNKILAASDSPGNLPQIQNRFMEGKTLIYVCENNSCLAPVEKVEHALAMLNPR